MSEIWDIGLTTRNLEKVIVKLFSNINKDYFYNLVFFILDSHAHSKSSQWRLLFNDTLKCNKYTLGENYSSHILVYAMILLLVR